MVGRPGISDPSIHAGPSGFSGQHGRDGSDGAWWRTRPALLRFTRGASPFDMTFAGGVWTLTRTAISATDFDQRMTAKFSADGSTITADIERTDPGAHEMKHDMATTYTRVTRR